MPSRLFAAMSVTAVLAGAAFLGACSAGSTSDSAKPAVDPAFAQLVEGVENGTLPPAPTTPSTTTAGSAGTAANADVNVPCLSNEINKRMRDGDFNAADVQLWIQGLGADGTVQKAADEILASGKCAK